MADKTDYRAVLDEARQYHTDSFEKWDPQRMDYESSEFNRYDVGPGKNLPRKKLGGRNEEGVDLFIQGIPNEMTEEGLENLFCKAGRVVRVRKMPSKKPEAGNTYGFITMSTLNEATRAIQMYNHFSIGQFFHLSVRISLSEDERKRRQQQKREEEEFLNSLSSSKKPSTNGYRFGSGNESDSSSSSAGKRSMPVLKMQHQQKSPASSSSSAVNLSEIDPSVIHNATPTKLSGLGSRFGTVDQMPQSAPKNFYGQQNMLSSVEDLKITIGQDNSYHGDGSGSRHISPKGASVGSAILSLGRGRGRGRGSLLNMVETTKQVFRLQSHDSEQSPGRSNWHRSGDTNYNGGYPFDSMGSYGHGMHQKGFKGNRSYSSGYGDEHYSGYGRGHYGRRADSYSGPRGGDYGRDEYWSGPRGYGRGHNMGHERDYYGQRHREYRGQFGRGREYNVDGYYHHDKMPGSYPGPSYGKARNNRELHKDDDSKVKHVEKQVCSTCGTLGTFNCSRCKTPYCSEDCQRRAWPEHKKICKRLSESNKEDKKFEQQFEISFGNEIVDKMKHQVEKITGDKVEVKPKEVKKMSSSVLPRKTESPKKQPDKESRPKNNTSALTPSETSHVSKIPGVPAASQVEGGRPKESSSPGYVSTEQTHREEQRQQPQLPRNEEKKSRKDQVKPTVQQSVVSDVITIDQLSLPDLPLNTETEVAVTEVEGPDAIWIQDIDSLTAANDLLVKLDEASRTAEAASVSVIGGIYLSQFSADNAWYRTVVESISGDQVAVRFIDYGNREVTHASGLKKLPKNLAQESLKAVQCFLGNLPSSEWNDMAKALVISSVEPSLKCQQLYKVTVIKKEKKRYAITIKDLNGVDLGKKIIDAGVAQTKKETRTRSPSSVQSDVGSKTTAAPCSPQPSLTTAGFAPPIETLPLNEEIEVMVSEVTSPDEIYIQMCTAEIVENIQKLPQEMSEVCSRVKTPLTSPVVGVICAAKFSQDGQWYRARIESIPEKDVAAVIFIDFGNRENVQFLNLQALPQQFLGIKVMATKCYLHKDSNVSWSEQDTCAVKEILVPSLNCGKIYSLAANKKDETGYGVVMKTPDGLDVVSVIRSRTITEGSQGQNVTAEGQSAATGTPGTTTEGQNEIQYATLTLNQEIDVAVTEVVSPSEIWINQLCHVEQGAQINSVLTQIISQFSPVQSPTVGGIYAGQFSIDKTWYRARVESLEGKNDVNVVYIDYGNKEQVSLDQLRELHPDLLIPEAYGIQCSIEGILPPNGEWTDAAIKFLKTIVVPSAVCGQTYKVTAVRKNDNGYSVVLKDANGANLSQKLVENGMARSSAATSPVPHSVPQAVQQGQAILTTDVASLATEMTEGQVLRVLIVEIESPTHFYVQIYDENRIAAYSELQKELDNAATISTDKEYKPREVGELVIALFSGQWFRAEVLSISQTKCKLLYIDFGNKEEVEFSLIRPAFTACTRMPAQAMTCALDNVTVPSSGSWSLEDRESLTQIIVSQQGPQPGPLEAHVKRIVGKTVHLDIKTGSGDSVSNLFMQSRASASSGMQPRTSSSPRTAQNQDVVMATSVPKTNLPTGQRVDSVVVSFHNFHSFYLQILADDQIELRNLMVNLEEHCMSNDTAHSPNIGELVCAKYEGVWYRACVIDIVDGYYIVQYVDFGNSESVDSSSIRKLPQSFATVPVQAVHCRLSGVSLDAQTEENITSFVASAVNVASKTEVVRKEGTQYEVIVYSSDGLNINEQLQPDSNSNMPSGPAIASPEASITSMTRTSLSSREFDVVITYVVSPSEFYVQLCDQEAIQKSAVLMQTILCTCETQGPDPNFIPRVGTLCCAYYQEDNIWYRAAVTQTYQNGTFQVQYLDFGNREIVSADKLRRITADFLELPIMAIKCSLSGIEPVGSTWNPDAAQKMKLFCEKKVHAMLIEQTPDMCILKITDDYETRINIADYLVDQGVAQRPEGGAAGGQLSAGGDADNPERDEEELQRQILALQAKLSSMKTKK